MSLAPTATIRPENPTPPEPGVPFRFTDIARTHTHTGPFDVHVTCVNPTRAYTYRGYTLGRLRDELQDIIGEALAAEREDGFERAMHVDMHAGDSDPVLANLRRRRIRWRRPVRHVVVSNRPDTDA